MCFDLDSQPPIEPIAGGALDGGRVTLTAADGNRFAAFHARAAEPTGAGMLILPDVRGLHPFFEELALRFAERGIDAVAIDYFGRTAGAAPRDELRPLAPRRGDDLGGIAADIVAGVEALRAPTGDRPGAAALHDGLLHGRPPGLPRRDPGARTRGRRRLLARSWGRHGTAPRRRSTSPATSARPSSALRRRRPGHPGTMSPSSNAR